MGTATDNKQRSPAQRGEWLGLSVRSAAKPKGSSGAPATGLLPPHQKAVLGATLFHVNY